MINLTTALRYMSDRLQEGVVNEMGIVDNPYSQRLNDSVLPAIIGAKVVMVISLLERLVIDVENMPNNNASQSHVLKDKLINLGFNANWYGWEELNGLMSLRHCFAHEFGQVTSRQKNNIQNFEDAFSKGLITDDKGNAVPIYFSVKNDIITLDNQISNRLRLLSWDIVKHLQTKGLIVEKSPK
jgi:hypothetical protein